MNEKPFVNSSSNLERLSFFQRNLSSLTETSKQEYFSKIAKKLCDPSFSSKTYWYILKSFLTGIKVPWISPVFHENKFITDFREKTELSLSLPINAHWLKILVCLLLTVKILQIYPDLALPLLTMTLRK